jgi:hypothetical protein
MSARAKCVTEETDHRDPKGHAGKVSGPSKVFQVFYMVDDEEQSVEVVETNRIDPEDLIPHLLLGGSIYITPKKHQDEFTARAHM